MQGENRIVGFCAQTDWNWPYMTCEQHFRFQYKFKGRPASEEDAAVTGLLKDLDLYNERDKQASRLSGGMKRRLSIGCAVMLAPEVLLLDEPSNGLDIKSRVQLWGVLRRVARGKIVLLSTHLMEEVEVLCDEACIMHNGQTKLQSSPKELMMQYSDTLRMQIVAASEGKTAEIRLELDGLLQRQAQWREVGRVLIVEIPKTWIGQGDLVFLLEDMKERHLVAVYSMMKMTFEDVFLNILGK